MTALNVYAAYSKAGQGRHKWCEKNWLSGRSLARVTDVRRQLLAHLRRCGIIVKSAGRDSTPVRRALAAGFFSHAAVLAPFGCALPNTRACTRAPARALAEAGPGIPAQAALCFSSSVPSPRVG